VLYCLYYIAAYDCTDIFVLNKFIPFYQSGDYFNTTKREKDGITLCCRNIIDRSLRINRHLPML